jgi:hypothetical protein
MTTRLFLRVDWIGVAFILQTVSAAAAQPTPGVTDSTTVATSAAATSDAQDSSDLGSEAALSRNISLYESGRYEDCAKELKATLAANAQKKDLRPESAEQAQTYLAACLLASGKAEEGDRVFTEAIRNNPQMRAPDSLIFPQSVVDRFLQARERLQAYIRDEEQAHIREAERRAQQQDEKKRQEARTIRQLRALAAQETVVETNRRWLATVPFGVGQFQNRDLAAGWIFLGLETALLGTAITAATIDERLANRVQEPNINLDELRSKRQEAWRVLVASTWGFGLVAVTGIVHAHWRFVPERRSIRTRPIPPRLARRQFEEAIGESHSRRDMPVDFGIASTEGQTGLRFQVHF